jgi:hypothetical protein
MNPGKIKVLYQATGIGIGAQEQNIFQMINRRHINAAMDQIKLIGT